MRGFLGKVLLAVASCSVVALAIVATELLARRLAPAYLVETRGIHVFSPDYGWIGRPGAVAAMGDGRVTLNRLGYRGPELPPRREGAGPVFTLLQNDTLGLPPETAVAIPAEEYKPKLGIDYAGQPVIGVGFEDAAAYAKWAGKRLPREDEWEKAASWDTKTQTKRQWPWGDNPGGASANILQDDKQAKLPTIAPVGTYAGDVSPYGVFDLGGNVSEYVDSLYAPYDGGPALPTAGAERILRGAA